MTHNENAGRIPARHIILQNYRNNAVPKVQLEFKRFNPTHDIWAQANEALRLWAEDAPAAAHLYHKVEFSVCYKDGSVYHSCYLLQRCHADDPAQAPDISHHMRLCLETFAGLRRPEHLTTEDYMVFLHTFGYASRATHERLLAGYELPCLDTDAATHMLSPLVYQPRTDISGSAQPA